MKTDDGPMRRQVYGFEDAKIYYALANMDKDEPIGMSSLSRKTGIDLVSVRRMAPLLKECGLIESSKKGMTISEKGCGLLRNIPIELTDIGRSEYAVGEHQRGVIVRGAARKITSGSRQRDIGIMTGADGASVFAIMYGALLMPRSWNMDLREPDLADDIRSRGMGEGDVMVVCGANDPNVAAMSAISAALDLL